MLNITYKELRRVLLVLVVGLFVLNACSSSSQANRAETQVTDQQFAIYAKSQPVHIYPYSMPRDVVQQIYDAKMEARNTWTVWYALNGTPVDSCPSVGYPIPGGTQLTNPMRTVDEGGTGALVVPQGEPDGLFPPTTSVGTMILCVRNGKNEPTYVEPYVVTYAHAVKVVNGQVVDAGGDSTIAVQLRTQAP